MTIEIDVSGLPLAEAAAVPQIRAAADGAVEMLVYGEIGWDVTAKGVGDALRSVKAGSRLVVRINSGGGSAFDGLAMYSLLAARKPLVIVDGLAASAASLVMLAGAEIEMAQAGFLMIHDAQLLDYGNADDLRRSATLLDSISEQMARLYAQRMGETPEAVRELMRAETWFNADAAVTARLADRVIEARAVAASVNASRFHRAPDAARALFTSARIADAPEALPAPATQEPSMATDNAGAETAAASTSLPTASGHRDQPPAAEPLRGTLPKPATVAEIEAGLSQRTLARLGDGFVLSQVRRGATMDQVRDAALDALAAEPEAQPTRPGARMIRDAGDTARAALTAAIEAKIGGQTIPTDSPAAEFRGASWLDLARASVDLAGGRSRGLTRPEVARAALNLPGGGIRASMHTTSDFPQLLANVQQKRMIATYEAEERTFLRFSYRRTLPDFKTASIIDLGRAPMPRRLVEGASIEYGTIGETGESISLFRYAVNVDLSFMAIVNDDLGEFDKIPASFGDSCITLEEDLVYGLFAANAAMADGVAWFSGITGNRTFANTGAGTGTDANGRIADLTAAMADFGRVTDPSGLRVRVRPSILIAPFAVAPSWRATLSALVVPNTQNAVNPFNGTLQIVETQALADQNDVYLTAAAGSGREAVEVAYLEGAELPELTSFVLPDKDGVVFSLRHSFGAKSATPRTIRRITYA